MTLPLTAQNEIERRKAEARELLDNVLLRLQGELGILDSLKIWNALPRLRDLFGGYAQEAFDVEAEGWAALNLTSQEWEARLIAIGNNLLRSLVPPQFRLSIGSSLAALAEDPQYERHIRDVLHSRIEFWRKQRPGRCKEIIQAYRASNHITLQQLARKVGLDVSVIYALQRGERKCAGDKIEGLAKVLGCQPEELWPGKT